jgi:hypothetical protein
MIKDAEKIIAFEFGYYLNKNRWASYYQQIDEVISSGCQNILVVGVGDGVVPILLKHLLPNATVLTIDYLSSLKPDIEGDIINIKSLIKDRQTDCILCCQVLEHIEFKYFEQILSDMSSICKRLILGLPYTHRSLLKVHIKIPKIKAIDFEITIPRKFKGMGWVGGHYWELGGSYSIKEIDKIVKRYYTVAKKYHVPECKYHLMYVLDSGNES